MLIINPPPFNFAAFPVSKTLLIFTDNWIVVSFEISNKAAPPYYEDVLFTNLIVVALKVSRLPPT